MTKNEYHCSNLNIPLSIYPHILNPLFQGCDLITLKSDQSRRSVNVDNKIFFDLNWSLKGTNFNFTPKQAGRENKSEDKTF